MLSLPFLQRLQATAPLSEDRIQRILRAGGCTVSYCFGAVLAVDHHGQHYYLCRQTQLATMTVQQFREALALALSFRLRELGHLQDPDERGLA